MAKSQRVKRLKVSIGVPLENKLRVIAKRDGLSMSSYARRVLTRALARVESRP